MIPGGKRWRRYDILAIAPAYPSAALLGYPVILTKPPGAKPFMRADDIVAPPDAVWHSNRQQSGMARRAARSGTIARRPPPARKPAGHRAPPDFVPPQLCTLVERLPSGGGWAQWLTFC